MDPIKMRAERTKYVTEARGLVDLADQEKRELTVEENRRFEDLMTRADGLTKRIAQEETVRKYEEEGTITCGEPPIKPDPSDTENREMAYGQAKRFRSLGEQMVAVVKAATPGAAIDPRLSQRATGLNEGVPSEGGFLVQQDFAQELIKRTYETGQVFNRCRQQPISGNANGIKINAVAETSRADGSRWGGILAYWKSEAALKTKSKPTFRQIELDLKKLIGLCYATDELLADAAALEAVLMQGFSEEIAFKLDDGVINGTGAGQMLGILASPALVTVAIEAGQPADSLDPQNIIKMWSRCWGRSRLNAVWYINQDIEPQLFSLGIAIGTAGSTIYMPPGGLSGQPYGTLFGRPVIPIEHCQTLGDAGDIILFDPSQYIVADKGGLQSASSIHVQFIYDETVFRFVYRVDGQPIWHAALTPFTGAANTLSPYVTLAARA
jgi:HK97 family phage major capsid protein